MCPIEDVGYVAENSDARRKLKSQGHWFLDERALLKFLGLAILKSNPQKLKNSENVCSRLWVSDCHTVMGLLSEIPLDDLSNRATWRRDRRMGLYHNVVDRKALQAPTLWNQLREFLARVTNQPDILNEQSSTEYLAGEIGKKIFSFIMRSEEDMDVSLTLLQVGLDSLMAIELRRWWKQVFGIEISVLEVMNSGTIADLGKLAARDLRKMLAEISVNMQQEQVLYKA